MLCGICGVLAGFFEYYVVRKSWYLDKDVAVGDAVGQAVIQFFSYFILLSYLIPLSLIVSLEIIKIVQAKVHAAIEYARKLMHLPHTNTP